MSVKRKTRVTFNVSGEIFETFKETLARFPDTLLGRSRMCELYYCSESNRYFFDRNRTCFEYILYFYQSNGTLNCPPGIPNPVFEEECRFFLLPQDSINNMKQREGIIFDMDDDRELYENVTLQTQVWNILEKPNTSQAAWTFGVFSMLMIWFSIVTAFLETTPMFRFNPCFPQIELVLNTWFSTELAIRFICSASKKKFATGAMNWVDLFAVVPYFLLLFLDRRGMGILGIFKTLKFLRVLRLFRLSKHSRRLKIVGLILKSSLANFRLLMLCLVLVIFVGGTFIYFIEQYTLHDEFTSIPQGIWWSVQTFTSVGYGDLIPTTNVGRTFASGFMLFGVLTISLPVLTIVSQFTTLYPKNVECDAYAMKNKAEERFEVKSNCKRSRVVNEMANRKTSIIL